MAVEVVLGTVPDTVTIGPQQIDPQTVKIRGASSRVSSVARVVARVAVDASALNVDRDVDLAAVDSNGNQVPSIEIDPPRVHVTIPVAQQIASRTVPIVPQLTGSPAAGYKVTSITVDPLIVTLNGEAAVVSQLQSAPTEPIDISGRTSDLEAQVGLALPNGVSVTTSAVRVSLTIEQQTGTQTYGIGVALSGEQPGFGYTVSPDHANVILGGPVLNLSSIDPAVLVGTADVSNLLPGTQTVTLTFVPPDGLHVMSLDPAQVTITVTPPPPTPSPTPTPTLPPLPTLAPVSPGPSELPSP